MAEDSAGATNNKMSPPPDPASVLTYNGQPYGYLISGPPPPPYESIHPPPPPPLLPLPPVAPVPPPTAPQARPSPLLPRSYPNSCCCGCSIKTGAIIAGCYILVYGAIVLIYLILLDVIDIADPYHFRNDFASLHFIAIMAYAQMATGVFVAFGAHKNRPSYMKPWLIFSSFKNTLILAALVFGTATIYRRMEPVAVATAAGGTISVGLDLYCNVVVYSFYKHRRVMVPHFGELHQDEAYSTP